MQSSFPSKRAIMSRNEALNFLNIAHFFDHFFILIFPTAAIAIALEWNMTYGAALAMGTPVYLLFALGTLPAGWLGDRLDRINLLALFFIGCGASGLFIAISDGPTALMAGLGSLGLFAGLYHPVGLALVTDLATRPGRALAVNGVFGNMGLAGAAVATGFLADQSGWRMAFLAPAVISILIGCILLVRRLQKGPPVLQQTNHAAHGTIIVNRRNQIAVFVIICVSALFGGIVFNGLTISLPKFFGERLHHLADDLTGIGAYTGLVFAVAAFAQLPVGELLDRFGARIVLLTLLTVQILLLAALSFLDGWIVLPLALALVVLVFAEIPITTWLLGHYLPRTIRSRAVSVEYTLSLGVGAAIVPMIAVMHDKGLGFDIQFAGLACAALTVLAAAYFLPRGSRLPDDAISKPVQAQ